MTYLFPHLSNSTGVYKIENITNNKIYIGSSSRSISRRIKNHINDLKRNKHINKHLQNAWNKDGENNFRFDVLELCFPEDCIIKEQYWLDKLVSYNANIGYNINPVAGSNLGRINSVETRKKLSNALRGKPHSKEHTQKVADINRGRKNKNSSSQYYGVSFKKREQKWAAGFNFNKRYIYIGNYLTEDEAARAYDLKIIELNLTPILKLNFTK